MILDNLRFKEEEAIWLINLIVDKMLMKKMNEIFYDEENKRYKNRNDFDL